MGVILRYSAEFGSFPGQLVVEETHIVWTRNVVQSSDRPMTYGDIRRDF